ncbi:uncharacterized protein LOC122814512 [Protopterus annectens]|uniref:uncharacterized protein LOC122814512 n=1 Tax=Protopterus annectens TaxID=7888 RepID=UPI001CF98D63|nr:uncharacterized protein LOC122814512 [Protopterus annectens]
MAAVSGSANCNLEEELNCSICLSIYTDPVTLDCGHNFCQKCLENLLEIQTETNGDCFSCPECRAQFTQKPVLQRNLKLSNIVMCYAASQPPARAEPEPCDFCLETTLPAAKKCVECEAFLCQGHAKKHLEKPAFRDHTLLDPSASLEDRRCLVHQEVIKYYCHTDHTCTCVSCCVIGPHKNHEVRTLQEAHTEKEAFLQDKRQKLCLDEKSTEKAVQDTEANQFEVKEKAFELRSKLATVSAEMRLLVEVFEKDTLEMVNSEEGTVLADITAQRAALAEHKQELSQEMEKIDQLCQESDDLQFIKEFERLQVQFHCKSKVKLSRRMIDVDKVLRQIHQKTQELAGSLDSLLCKHQLVQQVVKVPSVPSMDKIQLRTENSPSKQKLLLPSTMDSCPFGSQLYSVPPIKIPSMQQFKVKDYRKKYYRDFACQHKLPASGVTKVVSSVNSYKKKSTYNPLLNSTISVFGKLCDYDFRKLDKQTHHYDANLTESESQALNLVANKKEWRVMKADKGGTVVIINTSDYVNSMRELLGDSSSYRLVSSEFITQSFQQVDLSLLDLFTQGNIDRETFDFLYVEYPKLATLFGIPKLHKQGEKIPFRPIVAAGYSKTETISIWLDKYLNPVVQSTISFLRDSWHLLELLSQLKLDGKRIYLASLNVMSLIYKKHYTEFLLIFQDKLKAALTSLELKAEELRKQQNKKEQTASNILESTANLELHISSEFARLHQFLQEREQQLIQQLRQDIDSVLKKTEEAVVHIKEQNDLLQEKISRILSQMESQDPLLILLGAKEIEEMPFRKEEDEDEFDECGIENFLGVYKGPIQFSAWKSMSSVVQPGVSALTLDPVTAHPEIYLAEDLSSAFHGDKRQQLPDSLTRFDQCACVLGCEGFTAGIHYWEVEVGGKTKWDLGVTRETARRKGFITRVPEEGYWVLCLRNGDRYMAMESIPEVLSLHTKPRRIGMYLDYEGGQLSFYNASNMSHIYTFTDTFTETLYPYFSPCFNDGGKNAEPLRLLRLML